MKWHNNREHLHQQKSLLQSEYKKYSKCMCMTNVHTITNNSWWFSVLSMKEVNKKNGGVHMMHIIGIKLNLHLKRSTFSLTFRFMHVLLFVPIRFNSEELFDWPSWPIIYCYYLLETHYACLKITGLMTMQSIAIIKCIVLPNAHNLWK